MPDYVGNIEVPEIAPSGVFPIIPDFGFGRVHLPEVVVHQFGSANAKVEQRLLLGTGAKRFTIRKSSLREADRISLRNFWENNYGPYGAFTYNAPNDDGAGTTSFICRFANEPLSWEFLSDAISSLGITLIEIPASAPTYSLNSTVTRFPSDALKTALLSQVQEIIPLVKIQPREADYPAIYVSDRRCTIGTQLYLARLLEFDGISQSIGNESDQAQFSFGNADRVMRDLANDVDLFRAPIEFSLFHVGTGIKLDLWKGEIIDWKMDSGPTFTVTAADGIYELTLPYPTRRVCRTCWKCFDDGLGCPFTAQSSGMDYSHFPDADPTQCDKGYETANGCLAHGMKHYFGGILAEPQGVRIKDNSTGTWGFGRSAITSTSIVADSIYDEVIPEIYTDNEPYVDSNGNWISGMPVNCKIAAGRDESDFYDALGIVGEGPLVFASSGHKLDGQYNHGYPGLAGLRWAQGFDPALATDFFSLGELGNAVGGDWRKTFVGGSTWKDNFAAGLAFLELRRSDQKGLQLSRPSDHAMQAIVQYGLNGWIWSAAGERSQGVLTNPIWIAVNMILRARGLRFADAATAEQYLDVDAAIAAAAICNESVDKLIGSGTETQFKFRGVMQEEKPLRDWIQEVLMNCLGYFTFAFGKLKLGVRENSSAVEPFTEGNILFQSLQLSSLKPSFNHLTANFADGEFEFAGNSVIVYDIDHAKFIGGATAPLFLKSNVNLSGTSSKSQAARIISTRLREELGGITPEQWKAARQLSFQTTVLALNTESGMICSMTHPDMPAGVFNGEPAPHYGEFRITGWKLNKDYSIEIQGLTTVDAMYDLVDGPKPADVPANPIPIELPQWPWGLVWHPDQEYPPAGDPMFGQDDGTFRLKQQYTSLADKSMQPELAVTGKLPVNDFIPNVRPPVVRTSTSSATGGSLLGDKDYFLAICARDSEGKFSLPSNIVAIHIPAGTNTNKITLDDIEWPVGTFEGYDVFAAGDDARMMCHQATGTGTPASIDVVGPLSRSTWSLPSLYFRKIRIKAKRSVHLGVMRVEITAVAANSISASGAVGEDDWTGRDLSVIVGRREINVPIWNFHVSAFNGETGEFTVSPDPQAAGVLPGDILVIRAMPAGVCPDNSIGDAKFQNISCPGGLVADEEIGNLVRIISGTGRGQVRRITDNDETSLTIDKSWDTPPDATSRFIVELPAWEYFGESDLTPNSDRSLETTMQLAVSNHLDACFLVQAVAVDSHDIESPDSLSPIREIYVAPNLGGPPGALEVNAMPNGTRLLFGVLAHEHTAGITAAEFRAKWYSSSPTPPIYADLRTPEEGGDLVHDGVHSFVVSGLGAGPTTGAQYVIPSIDVGRVFYAWRLYNPSAGWSLWSDGNITPQYSLDSVDTEDPTLADDGPPAGWSIVVVPSSAAGFVNVIVTRPLTHAHRILGIAAQIKDATTGAWRAIDANEGAAQTLYDGSAIDHVYNKAAGTLTKASGNWGSAAAGDLILFDRRDASAGGWSWDKQYCQWGLLSDSPSGLTISGLFGYQTDLDPDGNGDVEHVRVKIVKPPRKWTTEGYCGSDPDMGLAELEFWSGGHKGDTESQTFILGPIQIPAGAAITDLQARVWFWTLYSRSDDDSYSASGLSTDQGDECVHLDGSIEPIDTDSKLGTIFEFELAADRTLSNPTGATNGQPICWRINQDAVGGHALTLGNKFRRNGQVPTLSIGQAAHARTYIGVLYDKTQDIFDVVSFAADYEPLDPSVSKVAVSAGDTMPNYLDAKLAYGANISLTKENAGANEDFKIAVSPQGTGSGLHADMLDGKHASEIGTFDHASLTHLAYADANHTGFVPATRTLTTTAPLTGGGDLSANRTLAIDAVYMPREILTAARTYYVRTDGNDSNTGLVDSAAGAFLTIQAAVNAVLALDCRTYNVTIQIRDGTYTTAVTIGPILGTGVLTITGNAATPTNVSVSTTSASAFTVNAFVCRYALQITNLQVRTTTSGYGIAAYFGSRVNFSGIDFGTCVSGHVISGYGAAVTMSGNCTISGGGTYGWAATAGGIFLATTKTVTISGTPAFTYFAYSEKSAYLQAVTVTFSGSATGQRYLAQLNGIIQTNGGGANYFPGDSAGATATGGQYA